MNTRVVLHDCSSLFDGLISGAIPVTQPPTAGNKPTGRPPSAPAAAGRRGSAAGVGDAKAVGGDRAAGQSQRLSQDQRQSTFMRGVAEHRLTQLGVDVVKRRSNEQQEEVGEEASDNTDSTDATADLSEPPPPGGKATAAAAGATAGATAGSRKTAAAAALERPCLTLLQFEEAVRRLAIAKFQRIANHTTTWRLLVERHMTPAVQRRHNRLVWVWIRLVWYWSRLFLLLLLFTERSHTCDMT
jgi:hypothetical protein